MVCGSIRVVTAPQEASSSHADEGERACAAWQDEELPPTPWKRLGAADDFEAFHESSRSTTGPARHPGEAELGRRRAENALTGR
ncbi:hypothetical protein DLE01_24760 [Streptomyces sp. FT05W]|nr:hypothetical protein DLE01_24760 [Streptomyces sp. FT05W]